MSKQKLFGESKMLPTDNSWHRLKVIDGNGELPWFRKFMMDIGFSFSDNPLDFHLKEFNARNVMHTPYIEFETEEDLIAFKLRWIC